MVTDRSLLETLVKVAAESLELRCRKPVLTAELAHTWETWEGHLRTVLTGWARKRVKNVSPEKWVQKLMYEGEAPWIVFATFSGEGIGMWDGRWDKYFAGREDMLTSLRRHLERYLKNPWTDRLEFALVEAAEACAEGEKNVIDFPGRFRRSLSGLAG